MVGRPVRRARFEALITRSKGETDNAAADEARPEERRPAEGRRAPAVAAERKAAPSIAPEAPMGADTILGGLRPDQLDQESNRKFANLLAHAFDFAEEVMTLPLDPKDRNFTKLLSVKQAIATAMFTATARVRPGDLRDKDDDGVAALLDQVKKFERDGYLMDAQWPTEADLLN